MRKNILKKSLAIGIISMFALLSMFSGVSSTGNSTIEITKPAEGCWYVDDVEIASGQAETRIWGDITIEVNTFGDPDISYLKFYIDGNWKHDGQLGEWSWGPIGNDVLPWGTHVIKVEARDDGDTTLANASVEVIKVIKDEFVTQFGEFITMEQMMKDYQLDSVETSIIESNLI
jgi:hypothetical protein